MSKKKSNRPQNRQPDSALPPDAAADVSEADERAALIGTPGEGLDDVLPPPDTQQQRWIKYGSNVVLTTVVVIALAVGVTYLAQTKRAQIDTTAAKVHSLKPQTINIIKGLDQKVKIVSLYSEQKSPDERQDALDNQGPPIDYVGPVNDLLQEYKANSNNIEVESIDPLASPTKVDDLIAEVTERYGGEVKKYKEFLDRWPKLFKPIQDRANRESAEVAQLQSALSEGGASRISLAVQSILNRSEALSRLQTLIDQRLKQRPPDYRGVTDTIREQMEPVSLQVGLIIQAFERLPGMAPATQPGTQPATAPAAEVPDAEAAAIPAPIRQYIKDSLPRYRELKKLTDEVTQQIAGLGELKLDDLRQKLRERDAILVLGPDEMRSLSKDQVWRDDPDARQMLRAGGADRIKPKFAGEQQITTAVWSLTHKQRPKVAFVRTSGPPLAGGGSPFQRAGPLAVIAQRLRDYNFDVVEKDLSGTWAMQSRGMMMPSEPEPSDEDLKAAIWVVIDAQAQQNQMGMSGPLGDLASRLAGHLDAGGSALVLGRPRAPDLASALDKWGIQLRTDAVAVHEPVPAGGGQTGDFVEEAQKRPFVFVFSQYGDHLITRPLRSLDSVMAGSVVLKTTSPPGATVKPLLVSPAGTKAWGESDLDKLMSDETATNFDPKTGDVEGPIILAAASERQGAGRLVVFGGVEWAFNDLLQLPDPELLKKNYVAARFPGNTELFTNSVFWLAKMDTMIAISPSAMDVSRIKDMSRGSLGFWRIGVLLIGLPLAVVAAGTLVYLGRRD